MSIEKPVGEEPKTPLTQEEIDALEAVNVENPGEMDPDEAREQLNMMSWKPKPPHEKTEEPETEQEPTAEKKPRKKRLSRTEQAVKEIEEELAKPLDEMSEEELSEHMKMLQRQLDAPKIQEFPELEKEIETRISDAASKYAHNGELDEENGRIADEAIQEAVEKPTESTEEAWRAEPEKYEKTFELREQIKAMRDARANLVVLEDELNRRRSVLGRVKGAFQDSGSIKVFEERYKEAQEKYNGKRAEYIGAKADRIVKESQKLAEAEAEKHQEGKFEKLREGWRWLGEQNLEKAGWKPESKTGKFFARALSARTAISLGLLGGGLVLGAGSAVGIGALATRRALAGTSAGFGAYDLIRGADERKAVRKVEDTSKMSVYELEASLADLEARARYSGKKVVRSEKYRNLRRTYAARVEGKDDRQVAILGALSRSDWEREGAKLDASRRERRMKAEGLALGAIVGSGMLAELVQKGIFPEGTTVEEVQEVIDTNPALPADTLGALVAEEGTMTGDTLDTVSQAGFEQSAVASLPDADYEIPQSVLDRAELSDIDFTEARIIQPELVGVVREGGSASQAVWDLVESGVITEEQLTEAWLSADSMIELSSGDSMHISELGLTHAGDKIAYVPATEDVPAHFAAVDNPTDRFHLGDNEDLAQAFDKAGKPRPAWLEKALGTAEDGVREAGESLDEAEPFKIPQSVLDKADIRNRSLADIMNSYGGESVPDGVVPAGQAAELASEGALESGSSISFDWGRAEFQYNEAGNVAGIRVGEAFLTPGAREAALSRATERMLSGNYREILEGSMRQLHAQGTIGQGGLSEALVARDMPAHIARAREMAFRIDTLKQVFDASEPYSKEWYFTRYQLRAYMLPDGLGKLTGLPTRNGIPLNIFKKHLIP